eukprot:TRINITY_DN46973_c0_g1_i1.p1 TRINITY_DN46973_c0_g1~~TRINITY_DN46973_c0_g1_i1.p1  ORF type:complete len:324 (-),score=68.26 TRINITY_DN46973_c0_g1_i1:129-1055(-)
MSASSSDSSSSERTKKKKKEKKKGKKKENRTRKKALKRRRSSESDEERDHRLSRSRQERGPRGGTEEAAGGAPRAADLTRRSKSRDDPPKSLGAYESLKAAAIADLAAASGVGGHHGSGKGFGKGGGKDGGKSGGKGEDPDAPPKEEPNFEASGLLGLEDNSKNGAALNFTLPPESRKPTVRWRLYIFAKDNKDPKIVHVHRQPGYLFGKDRRVADIPTDHQTCSKQHAVLHYRLSAKGDVRPYIMDLESKNGTFLNGDRIEPARYYEIKESDMFKFAMSSREYVMLHAGSANHLEIDAALLKSGSEK